MTLKLKLIVLAAVLSAGACATKGPAPVSASGWAAHGYLSPNRTDDPEIIGTFASKEACDAAVEDWMSHQVVGNPVSGECLPVDNY